MLFEGGLTIFFVWDHGDMTNKSRLNFFNSLFMRNTFGMIHVTRMLSECETPFFIVRNNEHLPIRFRIIFFCSLSVRISSGTFRMFRMFFVYVTTVTFRSETRMNFGMNFESELVRFTIINCTCVPNVIRTQGPMYPEYFFRTGCATRVFKPLWIRTPTLFKTQIHVSRT